MNSSKTKVRMVAKNPVGVGKIQFFVNGKEIAWLNTLDFSDPKLASPNGTPYFSRVVELKTGKNRPEITVVGKRVWFATYALK